MFTAKNDFVLIDCRTKARFNEGSIPSAVNIPKTELFGDHMPKPLEEV